MKRRATQSSRRGWRSIDMDVGEAGKLMREAGVAADGDPISARASFDDAGRVRRIHARYADDWRATMNVHCSGGVTISQTLTMRVRKPA